MDNDVEVRRLSQDSKCGTVNSVWWCILHFLRPFRWTFLGLVFLMLVPIGFVILLPYLMKNYFDVVLPSKDMHMLIIGAVGIFFAIVMRTAAQALQDFCRTRFSQKVQLGIQLDTFTHAQSIPANSLRKLGVGDIFARLYDDVRVVTGMLTNTFLNSIQMFLQFTFSIMFLAWLNWQVVILVVGMLPFYFFVLMFVKPKLLRLQWILRTKHADMTGFVMESLSSLETIRALGVSKIKRNDFESRARELIGVSLRSRIMSISAGVLISIIDALMWLGVMGYGGFLVIKGDMSVGDVVAFYTVLTRVVNPVKNTFSTCLNVVQAKPSVDRVRSFLSIPKYDSGGSRNLRAVKDMPLYRLDKITYSFSSGTEIFRELSLDMTSSPFVAVTGENGCGKTTLLNILARMFPVSQGIVCLGGYDVREYSETALRRNIGLASRDNPLFNATVAENVALAYPAADQEMVKRACEVSLSHEFISDLPQQYDTLIGQRGVQLSAGQRQRIILAQIFLKRPPIVLIDECLDAIEPDVAMRILNILLEQDYLNTLVIVSHNEAIIRNLPRVIVLGAGEVIADGTWGNLDVRKAFSSFPSLLELSPEYNGKGAFR